MMKMIEPQYNFNVNKYYLNCGTHKKLWPMDLSSVFSAHVSPI